MSVLFKLPESSENFTIAVVKATGGARLGNIRYANLQIIKNDDPIFFSGKDTEKDVVLWREGGMNVDSVSLQSQWLLPCRRAPWQISLCCGPDGQTLLPL